MKPKPPPGPPGGDWPLCARCHCRPCARGCPGDGGSRELKDDED